MLAKFHDEIVTALGGQEVDELYNILVLQLLENGDFGVNGILQIIVALNHAEVNLLDSYLLMSDVRYALVHFPEGTLAEAFRHFIGIVSNGLNHVVRLLHFYLSQYYNQSESL